MNKNTHEDHLKYIKMIEQGYSIDICKHRSISHKDLEVLWHRYQKDGPSGLVKKVRRLKDGKTREMILREIDAKFLLCTWLQPSTMSVSIRLFAGGV